MAAFAARGRVGERGRSSGVRRRVHRQQWTTSFGYDSADTVQRAAATSGVGPFWRVAPPRGGRCPVGRDCLTAQAATAYVGATLRGYRERGLAGLVRKPRNNRGQHQLPTELQHLIEGLALRRPRLSAAAVY